MRFGAAIASAIDLNFMSAIERGFEIVDLKIGVGGCGDLRLLPVRKRGTGSRR